MIGEVLDCFLRSLLVFDWRYGDNVSKLLVVVIELGLDADDDPDGSSDGNEKEAEPVDPDQIVKILGRKDFGHFFFYFNVIIVLCWPDQRGNSEYNSPSVKTNQVIRHREIVEGLWVLGLVTEHAGLRSRAVEESPVVVDVPAVFVGASEYLERVIQVLECIDVHLVVNNRANLREKQQEVLQSIECLQSVVIN